ncbi:MAG: carboxypeptidase regulatory-like domain-containing protein [Planctomycetota bacterium]
MRTLLLSVFACLLFSTPGCSGSTGPTTGVVRFVNGSPVRAGSIEFRRLSDSARYASRIASNGSFQPESENGTLGLPPGEYEVVVVQIVLTEDLAKVAHTHGSTVPRRYADYYTSGLRYEVKPGDQAEISISLETE